MDSERLRNKRIAYIHNVEIEVDTRAQKEIASLKRAGATVFVCAWDKNQNKRNMRYNTSIRGMDVTIENICVKVKKASGLKGNLLPLIRYQFKLLRWLLRNKKDFDYIHAVDLDVSFLSSIFGALHNKKFIYDVFDDYADCHARSGSKIHKLIRWLDKGIINRASVVIICSEKRKEQLAVTPRKIEIIHNAPDISEKEEHHNYSIDKSKLNIVYVGNLFPGRMTMEMARIIAENEKYVLHCGGAGQYEEELRIMSQEHNNMFFYGRMQYEDVIDLESQCDVLPALYDPSFANHKYAAPNKFYEALSLGKPTIMAHNTGMDDEVLSLHSGVVIDFNIESLKDALYSIYENRDYWRKRKTELCKYFNERYSWTIMEERLIKIYKEI